jgi:hypothetical protein
MSVIHEFFGEIDAHWATDFPARLSIIGCGALMLQVDYERGTKDGDVFETLDLSDQTKTHLLALAGAGTAVAIRRKLYIDIVKNGIPFLPTFLDGTVCYRHFDVSRSSRWTSSTWW